MNVRDMGGHPFGGQFCSLLATLGLIFGTCSVRLGLILNTNSCMKSTGHFLHIINVLLIVDDNNVNVNKDFHDEENHDNH